MTKLKDLGYQVTDNKDDRYAKCKFTLTTPKKESLSFFSIFEICRFVITINMSDEEHLAYIDAKNPFRVKMKHFLDKMSLNEEQRDYIENHIFSNVLLKDDKKVKEFYGKELKRLNCVKEFKEYRNNMITFRLVSPYNIRKGNY